MNLPKAKDRIQVSTVCLFFCTLGYFASAWRLYGLDGQDRLVGVLVGLYALALYWVMGVLAIDLKRWAWRISNAAFMLHVGVSAFLITQALHRGAVGLAILVVWVAVGIIGLWANLRPASRAALFPAPQSGA